MDKSKLAQLDPKLREAYERVMSSTIPAPPSTPQPPVTPPPQTPSEPPQIAMPSFPEQTPPAPQIPSTSPEQPTTPPPAVASPLPPSVQPSMPDTPKTEVKPVMSYHAESGPKIKPYVKNDTEPSQKKGISTPVIVGMVVFYIVLGVFFLYYLRGVIPFSPFAGIR